MDLVKKLWGNLEYAIDKLENQKPSGFRFERRRTVRVWELIDMIIARPLNRPKEHRVGGIGGVWQLLTDDVIMLSCSGLKTSSYLTGVSRLVTHSSNEGFVSEWFVRDVRKNPRWIRPSHR